MFPMAFREVLLPINVLKAVCPKEWADIEQSGAVPETFWEDQTDNLSGLGKAFVDAFNAKTGLDLALLYVQDPYNQIEQDFKIATTAFAATNVFQHTPEAKKFIEQFHQDLDTCHWVEEG